MRVNSVKFSTTVEYIIHLNHYTADGNTCYNFRYVHFLDARENKFVYNIMLTGFIDLMDVRNLTEEERFQLNTIWNLPFSTEVIAKVQDKLVQAYNESINDVLEQELGFQQWGDFFSDSELYE